jgi:hypothetical protein
MQENQCRMVRISLSLNGDSAGEFHDVNIFGVVDLFPNLTFCSVVEALMMPRSDASFPFMTTALPSLLNGATMQENGLRHLAGATQFKLYQYADAGGMVQACLLNNDAVEW